MSTPARTCAAPDCPVALGAANASGLCAAHRHAAYATAHARPCACGAIITGTTSLRCHACAMRVLAPRTPLTTAKHGAACRACTVGRLAQAGRCTPCDKACAAGTLPPEAVARLQAQPPGAGVRRPCKAYPACLRAAQPSGWCAKHERVEVGV